MLKVYSEKLEYNVFRISDLGMSDFDVFVKHNIHLLNKSGRGEEILSKRSIYEYLCSFPTVNPKAN